MDIDSQDGLERERLHFAAGKGDMALVKHLLAQGAPVNTFDDLGKTPLHYAVAKNHLRVAKLLLAAGANIDATDESKAGNTPLGDVAGNCSLEVAEFLLNHGADPTIPGSMQLTALHRALQRKRGDGPAVVHRMLEAIKQRKRHKQN